MRNGCNSLEGKKIVNHETIHNGRGGTVKDTDFNCSSNGGSLYFPQLLRIESKSPLNRPSTRAILLSIPIVQDVSFKMIKDKKNFYNLKIYFKNLFPFWNICCLQHYIFGIRVRFVFNCFKQNFSFFFNKDKISILNIFKAKHPEGAS